MGTSVYKLSLPALTKVRVDFLNVLMPPVELHEKSPDQTDDYERGSKGWLLKIFINETVTVETPHLFRVVLYLLKGIAENEKRG